MCWKSGEVPAYLTISARSRYGGYMQPENQEDKGVWTKQEILGQIRTALGGRAAEIVYYGRENGLSTGAAGDLETATQLAQYMICSCGMDEEMGLAVIDRSNETVRRKMNEVLASELERAINEIEKHRAVVDRLAEELIQETHIDGVRMQAIFGEC